MLAWDRSGGMCEGCGGRAHEVHHRQPRGMGGVKGRARDVAHSAANQLALCRTCHALTEHEPAACRRIGWLVPHPLDSAIIPAWIFTPQGIGWWQLLVDAGYRWVDELQAKETLELYGLT